MHEGAGVGLYEGGQHAACAVDLQSEGTVDHPAADRGVEDIDAEMRSNMQFGLHDGRMHTVLAELVVLVVLQLGEPDVLTELVLCEVAQHDVEVRAPVGVVPEHRLGERGKTDCMHGGFGLSQGGELGVQAGHARAGLGVYMCVWV